MLPVLPESPVCQKWSLQERGQCLAVSCNITNITAVSIEATLSIQIVTAVLQTVYIPLPRITQTLALLMATLSTAVGHSMKTVSVTLYEECKCNIVWRL